MCAWPIPDSGPGVTLAARSTECSLMILFPFHLRPARQPAPLLRPLDPGSTLHAKTRQSDLVWAGLFCKHVVGGPRFKRSVLGWPTNARGRELVTKAARPPSGARPNQGGAMQFDSEELTCSDAPIKLGCERVVGSKDTKQTCVRARPFFGSVQSVHRPKKVALKSGTLSPCTMHQQYCLHRGVLLHWKRLLTERQF